VLKFHFIAIACPSHLLRNEAGSTPWPDNIWDTSDQHRFLWRMQHCTEMHTNRPSIRKKDTFLGVIQQCTTATGQVCRRQALAGYVLVKGKTKLLQIISWQPDDGLVADPITDARAWSLHRALPSAALTNAHHDQFLYNFCSKHLSLQQMGLISQPASLCVLQCTSTLMCTVRQRHTTKVSNYQTTDNSFLTHNTIQRKG